MTKTLTGIAIALALLALPATAQEAAQDADRDGEFFVGFAGSAVFPYDPKSLAGPGLKAGTGFTTAFGYAFKEGFSTEIEWGYQRVGIGNSSGNFSQTPVVPQFNWFTTQTPSGVELPLIISFEPPSITIEIDGAIKTQSLMGNVYYRYPKWRVSPYAGFGLGAFFHDGTVTSTITIENGFGTIGVPIIEMPSLVGFPTDPLRAMTTVAYDDSRFAYQLMGGLAIRASNLVEFRLGYRFRSSRGEPIDADQIEAGVRFQF